MHVWIVVGCEERVIEGYPLRKVALNPGILRTVFALYLPMRTGSRPTVSSVRSDDTDARSVAPKSCGTSKRVP